MSTTKNACFTQLVASTQGDNDSILAFDCFGYILFNRTITLYDWYPGNQFFRKAADVPDKSCNLGSYMNMK